jgi:hypothetical protein
VISAITLLTIVSIAVFGQHQLRLLALACGLVAGLFVSVGLGLVGQAQWSTIAETPWWGWPEIKLITPAMSTGFIPLCIVMALVLCVDNIGMLVSIQRQGDPHWQKIDYRQASAGVSISSVGDVVAALFGGMPTGISSANISLAHATGNLSRRVSLVTGLLLITTAFTPRFVTALTYLPKPVIGAVMVYAAAYMLVSGMSLFLTRLLSPRRIFIIGLALVMGLTPALIPGVFANTPDLMRPILESPLAMGTFSAMLLVLMLNLRESPTAHLTLLLQPLANESVQEFHVNRQLRTMLLTLGEQAGSAKEQIERTVDIGSEFIAAMAQCCDLPPQIDVECKVQDQLVHVSLTFETATHSTQGQSVWEAQHVPQVMDLAKEKIRIKHIGHHGAVQTVVLLIE